MKISLVYSHDQSHWLSCQFITKNLLASYARFLPIKNAKKCQIVNFHKQLNESDVELEARKIVRFCPDLIIFVDHTPHPYGLINYLARDYRNSKETTRPKIYFHVYGDFPLMSFYWMNCEKALKQFEVKWFCASNAQLELLKKFIKGPHTSIKKIPFPVDGTTFNYRPSFRHDLRKRLKISDEEIVFLYTGRISYQKRLAELLTLFEIVSKSYEGKCKLLIAGNFDNLGNPYIGDHLHEGEYSQKLIGFLSKFPKKIRDSILYLGNIEQIALSKVYNASDIFVSLSTHNDEDFGMSPAEALLTGLPAILTNWGGYACFNESQSEVSLVNVRISKSSPVIDIHFGQFLAAANRLMTEIENIRKNRKRRSLFNAKQWEITSIARLLNESLSDDASIPFKGFTNQLSAFSGALRKNTPFVIERSFYSPLYNELYENYISKKL